MTPIDQASTESPASPRLTGWKALVVWIAVPIDFLMILWTLLVPGPENGVRVAILVTTVTVASFGVVGALVVTRLPGNPIGWILWATASIVATSIAADFYATLSVTSFGGTFPATVPLAVLSQADLLPMLGIIGIFVPMHFPDGRLPSARWRGAARFSFVAVALASVLSALTPGPLSGGSGIVNPIGVAALGSVSSVLGLFSVLALLGSLVLAVASVVARYRGGDPIARQQLRWFVGAVALMAIFVALGSSNIGPLAESGWLLLVAGIAFLPIAIGIAVLRYRLYEIDRIISRTIGWTVTTAVIVAVFAGVVVGLQGILGQVTGGNTLAVAGSTLVAFALFQPLRRRVQGAVDRRFNRSRYDAQRAVDGFADGLRNGVGLTTLRSALVATANDAVRPASSSVWLRNNAEPGT